MYEGGGGEHYEKWVFLQEIPLTKKRIFHMASLRPHQIL